MPFLHETSFKSVLVRRGLKYRYYSNVSKNKVTLLFLHGFPCSADDWHRQINFFQPKGYGIIAPDLLGFGGTAKPIDPEAFVMNKLASDIVDILDAEGVSKVVGIGHDWGCVVLSRLSMLHPERFASFIWLGLSFMEPVIFQFDLKSVMAAMKQLLGYEGYSYWEFFLREDASKVIEQNIDSFIQLLYPHDPDLWRTYMALPGRTAEWMDNNMQPSWPIWMSGEVHISITSTVTRGFSEEIACLRRSILDGGIKSGLNYYVAQVKNLDLEDNLQIPEDKWTIQCPSLFVVALKDCICTPKRGRATMQQFGGPAVTYVEVETGHWPHLEATDEVNHALEKWLAETVPSL